MVRRVGLTTDFESVRSELDATRPLLLLFTDGADTSGLLFARCWSRR